MASGPFPATCFRRPLFSLGQPAKKDVSSPAPASGTPPLPQRSHAVRRLLRRHSWRLAFHLGSPFSATGRSLILLFQVARIVLLLVITAG
ncbi:hypothetical protein FKM82_023047 [Ascaphus truei]